jgi:hypothetical protein
MCDGEASCPSERSASDAAAACPPACGRTSTVPEETSSDAASSKSANLSVLEPALNARIGRVAPS